ncbi:MAG: FAD-binding oxidoreductase [Gammaproteobacteria bacterium]|nr:FAD-binding oxidoreductase [Gammaproteobacteria bacterium]
MIGGGFYGCCLAIHLRQYLDNVIVLEKEDGLVQRASLVNQARVHQGYHYPRSLLTAFRSRMNFPKFVRDFPDCIDDSVEKYYAVGKIFSNITADQFRSFCQRIGAPLAPASREIKTLFNPDLIEDVFSTTEYVFDAVRLKSKIALELERQAIEVALTSECTSVAQATGSGLDISWHSGTDDGVLRSRYVFNCAYSQINKINVSSGRPAIPLRHELTEMALVEMPDALKHVGITVMCGPFFSVMPFPPRKLHTLSHVRYTPHHHWQDAGTTGYVDAHEHFERAARSSNYPYMIKDAQRYTPVLADCRYVESLWEIKTVLPRSDIDDSRPILFRPDEQLPGLISVLGGKIDNIYDVQLELDELFSPGA